MPRIPFSQLPDDARLWIFPASRSLSPQEEADFLAAIDGFLENWAAHGSPLVGGRDWREGRFLMVGVDEASVPPSGCSIDSLVRVLKEKGTALGASFLDNAPVWYRGDGKVRSVSRPRFKALAEAGKVTSRTLVLDNSITRLGQLRGGGWEKPAGDSWHGKAFFGL